MNSPYLKRTMYKSFVQVNDNTFPIRVLIADSRQQKPFCGLKNDKEAWLFYISI